jgi:replicative DNA helicase
LEIPHQRIFNKSVERVILSSLIFQPEFIEDYSSEVRSDDFYIPFHRELYRAILKLHDTKKIVSEEMIKEELEKEDKFREDDFFNIFLEHPVTKLEFYVKELKSKSTKRRLLQVAKEIEEAIFEQDMDSEDLLNMVEERVYAIGQESSTGGFKDIHEAINETQEYINEAMERDNKLVTGIDTGFTQLNKMTTGFNEGDLIIIAARPAMGKTAVALNFVYHTLNSGKGVAFFSLEMPVKQLMLRILSMDSLIPLQNLRTGELTDMELGILHNSLQGFRNKKLFVDDDGNLNIHQLRTKMRKLKAKNPDISLVVVDYIQIMNSVSTKDRHIEVSDISRGLKLLARELKIPIIALSQLNRSLETRNDKRPIMSDIRESGCLTGDSLVLDSTTGKRYRIDEVVENREKMLPFKTKAMGHDLKMGDFDVVNAFYSGVKKVYRMTLKSGKSIKATANHKFYRVDGWIPLGELEVGDKIATPNSLANGSEIYWDEIVLIEELREDKVYDLTVDTSHNFTVNNIISHNSIEQDADIILFVYRDDVYRLKAEKEREKEARNKGEKYAPEIEEKTEEVAEIIIGKQRNGPTGVVKLSFQKRITRFVDYSEDHIGIDEEIQKPTQFIAPDTVEMPTI